VRGLHHLLLGYTAAHEANALRTAGDLKAAEAKLQEAKRLWQAGSDPDGLLDAGKLLDLERGQVDVNWT